MDTHANVWILASAMMDIRITSFCPTVGQCQALGSREATGVSTPNASVDRESHLVGHDEHWQRGLVHDLVRHAA